jgi:Rod binding domain-containing protein
MATEISGVASNAFSQMMDAKSGSVTKAATRLNGASKDDKIESSAKQFESILLASWMQSAEKSFATVPGGDPDEESKDPGKGQFQQFAMQSVATALVNDGGIGIASMVAAGLRKAAGSEKTAEIDDGGVSK